MLLDNRLKNIFLSSKGLQMSFAWLFAIIVGAFILFLAIVFVRNLIGIGTFEVGTETAKSLDVILNPLETSVDETRLTTIRLPSLTRIYNMCDSGGDFGMQYLQVTQQTFGKWPEPGARIGIKNKYIFSASPAEGRKFYVFSRTFEFPFKVASVFLVIPAEKGFCFINAPEIIEDELTGLQQGQEPIFFFKGCPENSEKVCFGTKSRDCEASVQGMCLDPLSCDSEYDRGEVRNGDNILVYASRSMLYGAIVADAELYECQSLRLLKRAGHISGVYIDEAKFLSARGCNVNIEQELIQLENAGLNAKSSDDFRILQSLVEQLDKKNKDALCELWE
jgi:hypothetical protein